MRWEMARKLPIITALFFSIILATNPALADNHDTFYRGKTVRIVVGAPAGGGFDIYSRALARHMGKHIAGNPTLIVENMAGGGGGVAPRFSSKPAENPRRRHAKFFFGV